KSKQVGPTKKNKIKDNIKPSPPFLHFSIYILLHLAFNSCKQLFRYLARLLNYSFIKLFCLFHFHIAIIENPSSSAFSSSSVLIKSSSSESSRFNFLCISFSNPP